MQIVILAGGVGTRLWPLGRKHNPKQFFPMISDKPLVRETYDRFAKTYPKNKIFFSVTADLLPHLRKLFPRVPALQFIVEPSRRDTAPAMGYVATYLSLLSPDEPMVFVPSDHFVANKDIYLRCFKVGEELIKETGKMVDIGITATFPSTVLGYTKIAARYATRRSVSVYHFSGHTEKPDLATAMEYLSNGDYLWHGNYYMWTPRLFLKAFKHYAPAMHATLAEIQELITKRGAKKAIARLYDQLEKVSFDYAITEKIAKHDVLIIKGEFGWSDVGAWDVLYKQLHHTADVSGNVTKGSVIHVDTKNCLFYGHERKVIAAIGVENMVIVDTPDALLVCPIHKAQEVKKLFPELERRGLKKHL